MICNYKLKGGFTIEAVFIIPILFYIILLFIYLNFYLRDYNIMISKADYLTQKYKETGEKELIEKSYIDKFLNDDLWFSKAENISVNINYLKLRFKAELSLLLPKEGIFKIFSILGFNYCYEREFLLFDRTETARIFTVGINTISKIKGLNDIVEKYFNK